MSKEAKEVFVSDSAAMCHDVDAPFWHSQQDLSRNLRVKGRRPHRTTEIFRSKEAKEVFVSDSAAMCHDVDAPFWHSQQDLSRNLRVKGRRPHRTKKIFIESVDTLSRPPSRKCRYNIRLASVCMAVGFTRQNSRENSSRK